MKISALIAALVKARDQHGDLPVFTEEGDIARVDVAPCVNGVQRTTDGVPETPEEFTLIFFPS